MNNQLEIKPNFTDIKAETIMIDLHERQKREVINLITQGISFVVHVPQSTTEQFLSVLKDLNQNEIIGVHEDERDLSRKFPEIKIIGNSITDVEQRLLEFRKKKEENYLNSPLKYANKIQELNVWVNPDYLHLNTEINTTFMMMAKYAQNLYLFDHKIDFEKLSPELERALGAESDYSIYINQKK